MGKSINLHPKYGLNPTVCTCFWCGEDTGELALLGAAYPGGAPGRMVMNYEPCPACKEQFAKGITLIETTTRPREGQPAIDGTNYPTGRIVVITEEAARRIFDGTFAARVLRARKVLIDSATWPLFGLAEAYANPA